MSVCLYDEALIKKLKNWTNKTQINIYGPEESGRLFEVIGDETHDKPIQLPIICIRRNAGYSILNPNKKPTTYDGMRMYSTVDDGKLIKLSMIPINIPYQLDIYCRFLKEADALSRSLIFNIINHPTLEVNIPYNDINLVHNATMRVGEDVEDNSGIPERLVPGQFTRLTLAITVDDAYLWDARPRENLSVVFDGIDVNEDI